MEAVHERHQTVLVGDLICGQQWWKLAGVRHWRMVTSSQMHDAEERRTDRSNTSLNEALMLFRNVSTEVRKQVSLRSHLCFLYGKTCHLLPSGITLCYEVDKTERTSSGRNSIEVFQKSCKLVHAFSVVLFFGPVCILTVNLK